MPKRFKTAGNCIPGINYMVDITSKLDIIEDMIQNGEYFTINRARQFGKTTTLTLLKRRLQKKYVIWGLSFEGLSSASFENEDVFVRDFLRYILLPAVENTDKLTAKYINGFLKETSQARTTMLGSLFKQVCRDHTDNIVMIIDEVDQACNNKVFIDFLGIIRNLYLEQADGTATFQSVILASVYDIKNMKLKMRPENEHRYNSPWNIAVDFNVDMSFSSDAISDMLIEYKYDYGLDFDVRWFAHQIFDFTSGYPYLVSRICQILDEVVWKENEFGDRNVAWSPSGFQRAIKLILESRCTLFDDINKNLDMYPALDKKIKNILLMGEEYMYTLGDNIVQLGVMFGYFTNKSGIVAITNRIFETYLYNMYYSNEKQDSDLAIQGRREKYAFIDNGKLNMNLILKRFKVHYDSFYSGRDETFLEREGRFLFLTFLKPIINGIGNYYIEAETRNQKRTDVIVDYLGQQFIIELKIWYGGEYQSAGRKQLCDYLDAYDQDKGWLVSFCFNKNKENLQGTRTLQENGKTIFEVII